MVPYRGWKGRRTPKKGFKKRVREYKEALANYNENIKQHKYLLHSLRSAAGFVYRYDIATELRLKSLSDDVSESYKEMMAKQKLLNGNNGVALNPDIDLRKRKTYRYGGHRNGRNR